MQNFPWPVAVSGRNGSFFGGWIANFFRFRGSGSPIETKTEKLKSTRKRKRKIFGITPDKKFPSALTVWRLVNCLRFAHPAEADRSEAS